MLVCNQLAEGETHLKTLQSFSEPNYIKINDACAASSWVRFPPLCFVHALRSLRSGSFGNVSAWTERSSVGRRFGFPIPPPKFDDLLQRRALNCHLRFPMIRKQSIQKTSDQPNTRNLSPLGSAVRLAGE